MTEAQRSVILRVLDGHQPLIGLVYLIHKHPRGDQVFHWLLANRYTGKNLEDYFRHHFAPSTQKMIEHVLKQRNARPTLVLR